MRPIGRIVSTNSAAAGDCGGQGAQRHPGPPDSTAMSEAAALGPVGGLALRNGVSCGRPSGSQRKFSAALRARLNARAAAPTGNGQRYQVGWRLEGQTHGVVGGWRPCRSGAGTIKRHTSRFSGEGRRAAAHLQQPRPHPAGERKRLRQVQAKINQ